MWINVDFHPHICASSCNRMAITSYNPCSLWECSFIAWWPLDTLLLQQSLACLVPGSTSTPRSSSTGTVSRWWPFFLWIPFSPLQVMKEIQDTVEPPEEGVTMEVRNNRRWNLKRNPFQGSSGAGVEEHHGGRGRREKETEQNSNHQEPTQIRYNFCSETKAGLYIVKYLQHNISSQSKYGERKATVRRRTMRKKEEGGLSSQPIQEDDEASHSSNEPFAVRRTKSQKDPHGLEDRDVWFVIFFLPKKYKELKTRWKRKLLLLIESKVDRGFCPTRLDLSLIDISIAERGLTLHRCTRWKSVSIGRIAMLGVLQLVRPVVWPVWPQNTVRWQSDNKNIFVVELCT